MPKDDCQDPASSAGGMTLGRQRGSAWQAAAAWLSLYGAAVLAGFGIYTLARLLLEPRWTPSEAGGLGLWLAAIIVGGTTHARRLWCRRWADSDTTTRQLRDIIAAAPLAVYTINPHGQVTTWNAAAERVFGFTAAEAIGRPLPIIPPDKKDEHRSISERTWSGSPVHDLDVVRVRKDGTPVELSLSVSPMRDSMGRMIAAVAMALDVTRRRRAERDLIESEAKYDRIAANVPGVVYQYLRRSEQDRRFTYVSRGSSDVFAVEPAAFLRNPDQLRNLILPEDWTGFMANAMHAADAGTWKWEGRFRHPQTNTIRWISIAGRSSRALDGGYLWDGIITDVTALKEAESAAREATAVAEAAREAALAASAAKSAFLANISHEIRTPLNGVIGMAEVLMRKGGLTEQQLRYTNVIKSSGDALLALINDVLDFSKIEAGKLELHAADFDLRVAVEDVVEMLAPKAAGKGLALAANIASDCPVQVRGDAQRLRQVLINLVSNAVKFTETGEVVIRVAGGPRLADGPESVHFAVSDTGPGIAAERLNRLFKSFSQVDASTTRRYGGTGLGLAICKQLVELMGGTIGVESIEGRGSTFSFTLPFAPAATAGPTHAALLAPALRGLKILVVDDQPTYLEILQDQLSFWGLDAHTAVGGRAALAALTEAAEAGAPFRVALIDMVMPELDGPTLAKQVLRDRRLRGTAMMLMTAMENPLDAAAMRQAGFLTLLSKPVRQSALFDALVTTLDVPGAAASAALPLPAQRPTIGAGSVGAPAGRGAEGAVERRASVARPAASAMGAGAGAGANFELLLVEDNLVNQEVARELLLSAGYRVDVAGDGAAAVEAVKNGKYDLVLMDCQMPVMDGFEAASRVRQWERSRGEGGKALPIIALTANAVRGDRDRCMEAGMNDYLTKPIDPDAMLETLGRHLGPQLLEQASRASGATPSPGNPGEASGIGDRPRAGGGEGEFERRTVFGSQNHPHPNPLPVYRERGLDAPSPAGDVTGDGDDVAPPPPVDLPSLLRRCSGKTELVERLLGKFADSVQGQLDELAGALRSAEWERVGRLAHTLKGTSANLSAEGVRAVAAKLEQTAHAADSTAAAAAMSQLETQVQQCLAYVPRVGEEIRKTATAATV